VSLRPLPIRPRDLDRTSFTAALERLVEALPESRCVTFIDDEGEAVDLATRVDVFEARVAGAVLSLPLHVTRRFARKNGLGPVRALWIIGETRAALTCRVGEGLDLVLVLDGTLVRDRTVAALDVGADVVAEAAGIGDDPSAGFFVDARKTLSGKLRPFAVIEQGVRREVSEVLGALDEGTVTHVLVRIDGAREVLLRYD
jgi:hypothetical protein